MLPEECLSRGRGDSRAHIAAIASPHPSEGSGCVCPCPLRTDVSGARGTAWHGQQEQTLQPAHLKGFLNHRWIAGVLRSRPTLCRAVGIRTSL